MPLIYGAVAAAGSGTVVAQHTVVGGNVGQVATECLQHVTSSADSRMTITCDKHTFNFLKEGGWIFIAAADEAFGRQVPFAFLERIADAWRAGPAAKATPASAAGSFDRVFGPKIREQMEALNANPESVSKVAAVQKQVDGVKAVMVENIESVLSRGQRIELLMDRTEDLQAHAAQFQKQGRQLRTSMWWSNVKVKVAVVFAVLLLLAIIVLIACFSGGNRCTPKQNDAPPASPTP